jgi:acyl-CoA reductase-like NAD-dependent aldehyde dehydrogenase
MAANTRVRISLQELSFENAPRIVVEPPSPKSKELLAKQSTLESRAVIYSKAFPIGIDSARGSTIRDVDGNLFINKIVASDPRLPFGDMKKSGLRSELSRYGLLESTAKRTVWVN